MEADIYVFVNGKKYEVPADTDPSTPLVTFLRNQVGLKGTKYMCRQGACGACIVNCTSLHPATGVSRSLAVNSCLMPVLSCHGCWITTIEGIGNKTEGYSPVQAALARHNGTQCGFCSPGMVMNIYSLLSSNDTLTMDEVENSFGGNTCRCTGYRPILDAFKSLSSDGNEKLTEKTRDIEDLWKICPDAEARQKCSDCPLSIWSEGEGQLKNTKGNSSWYIPKTVEDVIELFKHHDNYRLIAGNTSEGVYKSYEVPEVYININHVEELKKYELTTEQLELGANMTLTELMEVFSTYSQEENFEYLNVLADHIKLIANVPVRNTGTLAGNLMIKYYHPEYVSDLYIIFETVHAKIITVSESGEEEPIPLIELYKKDMKNSLISKIVLQPISNEYMLRTFKVMPRAQNAFALVNAGFLFRFDEDFNVIETPNIIYGGIDSDFVHVEACEKYFEGKNIFDDFQTGISLLSEELIPTDSTVASSEYKKQLALNLFYKYVLNLKPDKVEPFYQSGGLGLVRPLSQGIQEYETIPENWPLTKPLNKLEAIFQCSGEAEYVNDIHELPGQLYGSLVLAEQAAATIKSIDPSEALAMEGVLAFYSAKDIPGKNVCLTKGVLVPEEEELFCSGKVLYAGQPLGILVAEREDLAHRAARAVKISYRELRLEQICLSVKDVLQTGRTWRIKPYMTFQPERPADPDKELLEVEGEIEMGPQAHYTMEPQSCVCSPTEDGLKISSATQWMACIQMAVSQALNIPENSIHMEVRRIGGGFGSKISRASMVATACALAAHKLHRPVKVILDLETNMKAIGKRNATYAKYKAGFDESGYIDQLKVELYCDLGYCSNESGVTIVQPGIRNCYDSSGWEMDLNSVLTSTPSSAWMRAPGTLEGMTLIEEVMEHVAFVLKKDPLEVRMRNIGEQFNFIDSMIATIKESSNYEERREEIETFNKSNRWKKKGISLIPMAFSLEYFFLHGSMVSVYCGDGTVSISHGGVEMGQGINTKAVQICASTLGIDESKVKVQPSSVLIFPNEIMSGASITSDNVVLSTMKACEIINKRLEPLKNKMPDATWEEIIFQAYMTGVNLNASYHLGPEDELKGYTIYGVAVSEVEVDILTGQYQILRADILEDAGESISPEIDIGQVEGGFVMGLGYFLTEQIKYDTDSGLVLTDSTANYWVPGAKDIPADFRVTLLKNAPNPYNVTRSKATGEPSVCISLSAVHALKHAVMSAREDSGIEEWLPFCQPLSVENVCLAAQTNAEHFKF